MRRILSLCLFACLLFACSNNNGRFKIEGSFDGFNEGELYVYGVDGSRKLDTVGVNKGRFEYNIPLEDTITLVIVFPNFSELPVFAESGAIIQVKGNATHLKETEIKGSDENELMTAFRLQTSQMTPPEVTKAAIEFVREHPASLSSRYILDRYFVRTPQPDYRQAHEVAEMIRQACPNDTVLPRLSRQLADLSVLQKGSKIPPFLARDINGQSVSAADMKAKVNVITLWATWNYESIALQNLLLRLKGKYGNDLKVLSVCLDADIKECRRVVMKDSVKWSTVCEGQMWESPVLQKTGLTHLPDNVLFDAQGNIIDRSLNYQKMTDKLKELLE